MLEFESEPDVEFAFFLAEKLGRTVGELNEMPHDEFVQWIVYYRRKAQRQEIEQGKSGR